jgi:hypothetical protein
MHTIQKGTGQKCFVLGFYLSHLQVFPAFKDKCARRPDKGRWVAFSSIISYLG